MHSTSSSVTLLYGVEVVLNDVIVRTYKSHGNNLDTFSDFDKCQEMTLFQHICRLYPIDSYRASPQ